MYRHTWRSASSPPTQKPRASRTSACKYVPYTSILRAVAPASTEEPGHHGQSNNALHLLRKSRLGRRRKGGGSRQTGFAFGTFLDLCHLTAAVQDSTAESHRALYTCGIPALLLCSPALYVTRMRAYRMPRLRTGGPHRARSERRRHPLALYTDTIAEKRVQYVHKRRTLNESLSHSKRNMSPHPHINACLLLLLRRSFLYSPGICLSSLAHFALTLLRPMPPPTPRVPPKAPLYFSSTARVATRSAELFILRPPTPPLRRRLPYVDVAFEFHPCGSPSMSSLSLPHPLSKSEAGATER